MNIKLFLKNKQSTKLLGLIFTKILSSYKDGLVVSLKGEMGSGKTTLVRAIIKELGHVGSVPSPTYTLIEPYNLSNKPIYQIDLYRIDYLILSFSFPKLLYIYYVYHKIL